MARLTRVAHARKEGLTCERCQVEIAKGDPYQWWKFRLGGKHIRCMKHTPASWERESNSKRQSVMQAEDAVMDAQAAEDQQEAIDKLQEAIDYAENVRDEFQSAVDSWADTNLQYSYQYEAFESAVQELEDWLSDAEGALSDLQGWEPEEVVEDPDSDIEPEVDEGWREYVDGLPDFPQPDF